MNKHTPTPWAVGAGKLKNSLAWLIWQDTPGREDIPFTSENKDFIVRACNAHEQLIEFLFDAIPYIEEGEQFNKPTGKRLSKQVRKFLTDLGELREKKA